MTRRVFSIRPEPGLTATLAAGRAIGIEIEGCPLFEICPLEWSPPAPDEIDALLVGSASAFRHGGQGLSGFLEKPVFAVGQATADAAHSAGFSVAAAGSGGLQSMLDMLAGRELRLLRLAGAEHVPVVLPQGITLDTRIVYESVSRQMPPELVSALAGGGVMLLHSGAAARHFASECRRAGVNRNGIALAALGPRIADVAGTGWQEVRSSTAPREAALLALALDMCH